MPPTPKHFIGENGFDHRPKRKAAEPLGRRKQPRRNQDTLPSSAGFLIPSF